MDRWGRTDRGEATRSAEILRLGHVDLEASWYWLKVGHLNTMSVRNIIACQEGCLLTRTHFSNTTRGKTCRYKCWITHPGQVSGCPRWRATLMYQRHDSVARVLHYNYCVKG
ncbi:hypothetical protein L596_025987 [Steinernema carpocapsae]|uniref:Uncharacterized protein n=1 Tax=Steinernema carpocapsae TaxID=34508 RepID=A0A4U5M052_STECR|nr:hypothetical protein L596_025987 [Steinernema carpocapsae]